MDFHKTQTFKTILIILVLILLGIASYGQYVPRLIVQGKDSVLVLNKPDAIIISNGLIAKNDFKNRLIGSLRREEMLLNLWQNTSDQATKQQELIVNLEAQLTQTNIMLTKTKEQLRLTEKTIGKSKRKNLLVGIGVGLISGLIVAEVIRD